MMEILAPYGWDILILFVAGALAGLINGVVGSGTLITFPAMLLMGFPPLTANVSSNLGLIPGSIAAAWQYRSTLKEHLRLVARMLPLTLLGSIAGGGLLLVLPSSVFDGVVPILIAVALLFVLVQPLAQRFVKNREQLVGSDSDPQAKLGLPLNVGLPLLGAYGGYFGAAQGILLLVLLGIVLNLHFREVNGFKNLLAAAANIVSGLLFLVFAPEHIDWVAVTCVAIGATLGGMTGGWAAKLLPQTVYRFIIIAVGCVALWVTLAR